MTEDQKKNLETQLCGIANLLRGKISADDGMFRLDYILGVFFFKYLSEKQHIYANELLQGEAEEIISIFQKLRFQFMVRVDI